jgi:hypothetical protein
MKCPFCGYQKFYLKNPEDDYETFGFSCESDEICFDSEIEDSDVPDLKDDSHIFCDKCTWKGKYDEIK